MRLFTAVTLGTEVEERTAAGLERLKSLSPRARWVNPHGVHLTLVFLGEVDASRLPELEEVLTRVSHHHAPFRLTIEGGGYFGPPRHPHVLWAGVGGDTAALGALQAEVATVLEPLGFPREKRLYTAHLTLARSREPKGDTSFIECKKALEGERWGESRVEHLILFESKSGRYEKRLNLPLTGGA
jgi:2'-5' RNA ligase